MIPLLEYLINNHINNAGAIDVSAMFLKPNEVSKSVDYASITINVSNSLNAMLFYITYDNLYKLTINDIFNFSKKYIVDESTATLSLNYINTSSKENWSLGFIEWNDKKHIATSTLPKAKNSNDYAKLQKWVDQQNLIEK